MYEVSQLEDYSAEKLDNAVGQLKTALQEEAGAVANEIQFKSFRDRWMARKNGVLTQLNERWLKPAPGLHKREVGRRVNEIREHVTAVVQDTERTALLKGIAELASIANASGPEISARTQLNDRSLATDWKTYALETQRVDITLPGIHRPIGAEHPVVRTMNEIVSVFRNMGYSVGTGPEIETDYYNFEALNFPPNHPARDTQDTIFIAGQDKKPQRERLLLRTHTSPTEVRTMENQAPPVRIVIPGKVHRNDAADATHSPMFYQVEGLTVDEDITFCDLKGTLDHAMKALFGSSVRTRFQPSFFPFTEPSAEVAISCIFCGGKGCRICKQSGWIELLGCGMTDPAVYGYVGYDPERYRGFAFGMGAERIAMLKYGIDDIQLFYQGDVRFLQQFV